MAAPENKLQKLQIISENEILRITLLPVFSQFLSNLSLQLFR